MDTIEFARAHGIRTALAPNSDEVVLRAIDFCRLLGRKRCNALNICEGERYHINVQSTSGVQACLFIKMSCVKRTIAHARSPVATGLAKSLGFDVVDVHCVPIEAATSSFLMHAFHGESIKLQFQVGKYYLDMYFDEYKIVVECDENHDTQEQKTRDAERESYVKKKLKCEFIRFKPMQRQSDNSMYMAHVVNAIYKSIIAKKLTSLEISKNKSNA